MGREAQVQTKIIKYLKKKGCYVIKTKPGPGVPVGCPDVIFLCGAIWGALECKASETARYQPLQKQTLEMLDGWSYARALYPENYDEIIAELDAML